ncbi:FtsX-like permease family protein [Herbihabitans rhizosphaerae]|uniref:FtsX-like permease family protein n=1 Tax=Herbihabitans rhizosphaerae TaxID=1872711 RepID=A0A4Q7L6Z3_9PSEU|nr:FtsX-like permease family protein [Herbihabitans rhizosphaerae]RZS44640.1 FtsX-like permease family protein [Herbihabitans rhizosphaerae]
MSKRTSRRTSLGQWGRDLGLGIRLAVGGSRISGTSIVRLIMGTVGIGLAVAILFGAASVGNMLSAHEQRNAANIPSWQPRPGVDPLLMSTASSTIGDERISVSWIHPSGPNAPLPPGVERLPGKGEMVVSPRLAEMRAAADGEALRQRFPQREIGQIDKYQMTDAGDLLAYVGVDATIGAESSAMPVYGFGRPEMSGNETAILLTLLSIVGGIVLLVPVLIFVATSTRIAGAERDRRLSAMRLVGADARQVRRITAGESLVSSVAGLALGTGLFLVLRPLLDNVRLFDTTILARDLQPSPLLALITVVGVPLLAIGTALFGMRRVVIEPLSVVRKSKPVKRRLAWRLVVVGLGVASLLSAPVFDEGEEMWTFAVGVGATLLLIGVPALLPWLVERGAARVSGGRPSVQLAIRRLQVDSGTPARVVAGVAVVLAGGIALQTGLAAAEADDKYRPARAAQETISGQVTGAVADQVVADARAVPGVTDVRAGRYLSVKGAGEKSGTSVYVMDCAGIAQRYQTDQCVDGDAFTVVPPPGSRNYGRDLRPGEQVRVVKYARDKEEQIATWTWPQPKSTLAQPPGSRSGYFGPVATPGAVRGIPLSEVSATLEIAHDKRPGVISALQAATAKYEWRASFYDPSSYVSKDERMYTTLRNALLAGAVFTLSLAGLSLLVLALEQVRERRRAIAALFASGVPRGVLSRSLVWQLAVPMALGVVVAIATGIGLAWLFLRLVDEPVAVDWPGVGVLSGAAVILVLLSALAALPALRSATRLDALRTE